MLHAVGGPTPDGDLKPLQEALKQGQVAAGPADTGLAIGSWSDGRANVPDALPAAIRARVQRIAETIDPDGVLIRPPVESGIPLRPPSRRSTGLAGSAAQGRR